MRNEEELQRPANMNLSHLGELVEKKLESLGYGDEEKVELASNLAFLYEFAIDLIQNVNAFIELPVDDRRSTTASITNIRSGLDHMSRTFIKSSLRRLPRLERHLYALEGSD